MDWFRFYTGVLDDPKVQSLDGDTFKAWVNILCIAAKNDGILPDEASLAFSLRMDVIGARSVLDRLLIATLIDKVKGGRNGRRYAVHGWAKRQYKSDSSTDRVKRYRERSKTVAETPPEQNRTEQNITPPTPPQDGGAGEGQSDPVSGEQDLKPEHVLEAWNDLAGRTGLARVDKLTNGRLRKVEALIRTSSVDEIGKALDTIEATPFLRSGDGGKWSGASFDWLINETNFTKITEGAYGQPAH